MCLCHYTSVDGFYSIVKDRQIRMTMSEFMNDPSECHVFRDLMKKFLEGEGIREAVYKAGTFSDEIKRLYENGADLVSYLDYLLNKISFYVFSCSKKSDAMVMWNNYGKGGMELEFDKDLLMESIQNTLTTENEFIAVADVVYVDSPENLDVDDISEMDFVSPVLSTRGEGDVFGAHRSSLRENETRSYRTAVYDSKKMGEFIHYCLVDYLYSLNFLYSEGIVKSDSSQKEIFGAVLGNTLSMYDKMLWKRDMLFYMIILSAALKSSAYKYKAEKRIIFIKLDGTAGNVSPNSVTLNAGEECFVEIEDSECGEEVPEIAELRQENRVEEGYYIRHIGTGDFICPCVYLISGDIGSTLTKVIASPLTHNLPVDDEEYGLKLESFLRENGFTRAKVEFSNYRVRWQ